MSTDVTRILVTTPQLMKLLEGQPEIELQLIRNAVPQIATILERKAQYTKAQLQARIDEVWKEIERKKTSPYGMPNQVREIIKDWLRGECRDEAKILVRDEARDMAKEAADTAVAAAMLKLGQDLEKAVSRAKAEVDGYIQDQVEQKFLELLRAGRLSVRPEA